MRNFDKSSKIIDIAQDNLPLEVLQLDVTDDKSVKDATNLIGGNQRRMGVVAKNAGYGSTGPVEDFSIDEIKARATEGIIATGMTIIRMWKSSIILLIHI